MKSFFAVQNKERVDGFRFQATDFFLKNNPKNGGYASREALMR
jgi:hypothetical protein